MKVLVCALLALLAASQISAQNTFANSFNFAANLKTAFEVAASTRKPIMLVVHRSYCPATQALLAQIVNSNEVKAYSQNLIMVHSDGTRGDDLAERQGGGEWYFPRIMFYDSRGNFMTQIRSPSQQWTLYYWSANDVLRSMQAAVLSNSQLRY